MSGADRLSISARRALSVFLGALLVGALAGGCTAWAEVRGPQAAVGFEYDFEQGVSPRFELGYQYMRYDGVVGYGGTLGVTVAPANERVELFVDGRVSTFLTLSSLVPMVGGAALAITPYGIRPGLRAGLSGLLFVPPEACTIGIEGDQPPLEQACGGEFVLEDVVHPNWLPRVDVLYSWFPVWEGDDLRYPHRDETPMQVSASFGGTVAEYWLVGGDP